ncbi:MAG TPA: PilW family protein [Candidatus Deferrimicrobiaceae bacterium]|nr:PilW family protein [Candidatus Deferrimicrobiaceae bacterium]
MRNSQCFPRKAKGRAAGFSEAGFTLVEMMAAFVILFIAMTAAYATFEFQHASFTVQNRVAETQQNLRSAMEVLGRDIMLAGYGIPAAVNLPAGLLPSGDNTIRTIDPLNSTTTADQIVLLYTYDMDASLPPTTLSANMGAYNNTINVASTNGFANGDYIIVTNGTSADLFQITAAITDNTTLPHNALGVNAAASHAAFPGYTVGATVSKARFVRYFIDTTDPAHPTLMLDKMVAGVQPQPLADDIEDMQFQYGLDTNGDFVVDTTAVNVPTAAQIPQIRQVRVWLSARTRMADRKWQEVRPAMGDRAAGSAADGYRRRTIDVAIDLRNP